MKAIHQVIITTENIDNYAIPNRKSISDRFVDNGYIYHLWELDDVKRLTDAFGDHDVWEAITKVKANAFKADIARYYIVYRIGGWYVDLNTWFPGPPPQEELFDGIFFRDDQDLCESSWAVYNGLFYFPAGSEVLKAAVDMSVYNVMSEYYGNHALCPTGPNLLGMAVASQGLDEGTKYLIGRAQYNDERGFYFGQRLFAKYKFNGLDIGESGLPGNNNYIELWNNRDLYG